MFSHFFFGPHNLHRHGKGNNEAEKDTLELIEGTLLDSIFGEH